MGMEEAVASTSSSTTGKRTREQDSWGETPEAKRLREDLLFDILDGDDDDEIPTDPASADSGDLADVMRSFEEEIAASVSPFSAGSSASSSSYEEYTDASDVQQQLGFLLEASDDELGLPPPAGEEEHNHHQQLQTLPATSQAGGVTATLEEATAGNYWGFQDQEEGAMMTLPLAGEEQQGWQGSAAVLDTLASFGDGPFGDDYGDVYLSWPSDLADFSLVA